MSIPKLLHHYTSGANLLNITNSGNLWATHILYMNDAQELAHAADLAKQRFNFRKSLSSNDRLMKICDALIDSLSGGLWGSMYVVCFSEASDSLSQWRGYCPPNLGYSLDFDAERLQAVAERYGFSLRPCIYDRARQEMIVKSWSDKTLDFLVELPETEEEISEFCRVNTGGAMAEFREFGPFLKHESFKDEREWRMASLVFDRDNIGLRPGKSFLVPYFPIELGLKSEYSPLWGITVGPTPHRDLAMFSLSHLFAKIKITNGIQNTQIPFRDW